MVPAFAALLVLHGLIHLIGFAKAFGLADLPQLRGTISPIAGMLWLSAAILFIYAAVALFAWPRVWPIVAVAAVVVSVAVIVPSWSDAKFGVVPNAIVAVTVLFGLLRHGPFILMR
jgi:hypothetical protein